MRVPSLAPISTIWQEPVARCRSLSSGFAAQSSAELEGLASSSALDSDLARNIVLHQIAASSRMVHTATRDNMMVAVEHVAMNTSRASSTGCVRVEAVASGAAAPGTGLSMLRYSRVPEAAAHRPP